jgi:hypothetical protein
MWIITAWHRVSAEVIVKGFKKCCISNKVAKTYDDMLWNSTEEDGNVRSVKKMKALTVLLEKVSLVGKGG